MKPDIPKDLDDSIRLAVGLAGFVRAGKGNVSEALRAIATGTHQIVPCGDNRQAREWILKCNSMIVATQPFSLTYKSPTEKVETFEVRWATIVHREKRYFLEAWVTESNPKAMPELSHNRSFRFDRIMSIEPASGNWHSEGLDSIEVVFRLYGKLSIAYDRRDDDLEISALQDGSGTEVRRKITETFWFTRSILLYGGDAEVISPVSIRNELRSKLSIALERYQD